MKEKLLPLLSGEILEEEVELSLDDLCRVCQLSVEDIHIVVEQGIAEPMGRDSEKWRFHGASVQRIRCAVHLRQDLGVNWAGAALALDLLEELRELRMLQGRFEKKN